MSNINIEIKARTNNSDKIRKFLFDNAAEYVGLDEQTDTYFNVHEGRLKLRQGKIENSLIYYDRPNVFGPKQSDFELVALQNSEALRTILEKALGVKITVRKSREIFFIGNVKFHLDRLEAIGEFVEIEAMNKENSLSAQTLHEQCNYYIKAFGIMEEDLISESYSDMLLPK